MSSHRTRGATALGRTAGVALGVVAALALAACSQPAPEADPDVEDAGPLAAYLEAALGADPLSSRSTWDREQELIAACMSDRGFEYIPVPYFDDGTSVNTWTREQAGETGWGIVAGFDAPVPTSPPDPNEQYVASLTPSAYGEYVLAYLGGPEADTTSDPDQQGCSYAASLAASDADVWNAPGFAALNDELSRRWDAVARDSRILAATDAWTECMADAGHPGMTTLDDPMLLIQERFASELGNQIREGDPRAAELAEDERTIAVIDFDCRESAGIHQALDAAQADWENDFIERNRTDLEALVNALLEADAASG